MKNNFDGKPENNLIKRVVAYVVGALVAVALVVTGIFCFGNAGVVDVPNTPSGEVSQSTNRGAQTGNTLVNNIKSGTYVYNDYLEYTNPGQYSVALLPGTYLLEAYGAQGGRGNTSNTAVAGGLGGYTYATLTLTSTTTVFIYVGGQGTDGVGTNNQGTGGVRSGGTNGGGAGRHVGGGGGGATHFATATGTTQTAWSSLLMVAGGGGGSQARVGGAGGGGNSPGVVGGSGCGGPGQPGTLTGGGAGGAYGTSTSGGFSFISSTAGGAGYGGNAGTGSDGNGSGGGGAGYYGGGGGNSDHSVIDDSAGGGGSGYIKTSGFATGMSLSGGGGSGTAGSRQGNGLARITINSIVNAAPTTKSYGLANRVLGATTQTINANVIGQDPDATTNTNGAATTVYFQTLELYLDSGCTTAVSSANYFTYSVTSSAITITSYNKLPRSGVNGQANNTLTVYCKIKDNFTQEVKTSVLSFTISFSALTVAHGTNTTGISNNDNTYRFGAATTTDVNDAPSGALYATQTGKFTLTVQRPIKKGSKLSINVADLLTGYNSAYYQVFLVPTTAANSCYDFAGSTTATVYDFTSGSSYTSYTGYSTLIINGRNPAATWQTLNCKLYVVEKSSVGATNREPTNITYTGGQDIEINFRVDNTRPIIRTSQNNVVAVNIGANTDVNLNTYMYDADETITASSHSIKSVIVPQQEFVQLDKYENIVTTGDLLGVNSGSSFYNVAGDLTDAQTTGRSTVPTGFNASIAATSITADAFVKYSYSGITLSLMGLRPSYSLYDPARTTRTAYTGGTRVAPTGSATVQNPGHFYLLVQIVDNNDIDDEGIWRPIAITVGNNTSPVDTHTSPGSVSGQGTTENMPLASGVIHDDGNGNKYGDVFYFAPMAVNVNGSMQPVGAYLNDDGDLTQDNLQPLALDGDNFSTANGLSAWNGSYNEFLTIASTPAAILSRISALRGGDYISVEYERLYVPESTLQGRVRVGTGDVSGVKYISTDVVSRVQLADGNWYYGFNGIKITLKSTTYNRYFNATVALRDAAETDATNLPVDIAVRVADTAPVKYETSSDGVALFGNKDVDDAYSVYDGSGSIPTLTYRVPLNTQFFVTPYDVIRDYNIMMEKGDNAVAPFGDGTTGYSGFTLNGLSGWLDGGKFTVGGDRPGSESIAVSPLFDRSVYGDQTYLDNIVGMLDSVSSSVEIGKVSAVRTFTPAGSTAVNAYKEKLFFARNNDPTGSNADAFTYNATSTDFVRVDSQLAGYVSITNGNTVSVNGKDYALDFVAFKANTRTVSPGSVTLIVRDRAGDSVDGNATVAIRVQIEVINTPPKIKDPSAIELKAEDTDGLVVPKVADFRIDNVMEDSDTDTLYLVMNRGLMVARGNTITKSDLLKNGELSFDNLEDKSLLEDEFGNSLNNYVTATIKAIQQITVTAYGSTKNVKEGVFVYFFVTDNRGGETLGYKQIEVVNTAPALNTGENGFSVIVDGGIKTVEPWNIEAARSSDITRNRYIATSPEAVNMLKSGGHWVNGDRDGADRRYYDAAMDVDVRLIASDGDTLSGVMLSPRTNNAPALLNGDNYEYVVPQIRISAQFDSGDVATGVRLFTDRMISAGNHESIAELPDGYSYELLFFADGVMYNREGLIDAIRADGSNKLKAECFDDSGRWILQDVALRLYATNGFDANINVGISFSVVDEAKYGGDTAGLDTAYDKDRDKKIADSGSNARPGREIIDAYDQDGFTVYQHITQTGIITKDAFAVYDNYYVVDVPSDGSVTPYLATYDQQGESAVYGDIATFGKLYWTTDDNNKAILSSVGNDNNLIKDLSAGQPANTKAGVYAGVPFGSSLTQAQLAKAYRYPDTIVVPSTKTGGNYDVVNIPMSFFGMLEGNMIAPPDDDGNAAYSDGYVTYDVRGAVKEDEIDETNIAYIQSAITISDGKGGVWTGNTLAKNPYVNIGTVGSITNRNGASYFGGTYSAPYYNRALSVSTLADDGSLLNYYLVGDNRNNFVGDGKVMYLKDQETDFIEHNFGLTLSKKDMRTSATNITLTVKLVKAQRVTAVNGSISGKISYEKEMDAATVSMEIRIDNSKFDLVTDDQSSDTANKLKYDEDIGTYYVDLDMATATSQEYALIRAVEDSLNAGKYTAVSDGDGRFDSSVIRLYYTDEDYDTEKDSVGSVRDYLYFSSDSSNMLSGWRSNIDSARPHAVENGSLVNTIPSARATNSVKHYYGIDKNDDISSIAVMDSDYQPNGGKYGTNNGGTGMEGYSSYLTLSYSNNGRSINIMSSRKTQINEAELKNIAINEFRCAWDDSASAYKGGLSADKLTEIYGSRGLKIVFDNNNRISRVYYPLKLIVYDDCGGGWDEASYTAIEFRVSINNATPEYRRGIGEENGNNLVYNFSLAVNGTTTFNLYDFVSDADMYSTGSGMYRWLATETEFLSNGTDSLVRETGDFLASPLGYTQLETDPEQAQEHLLSQAGAGFSLRDSTDADVIMWMSLAQGERLSPDARIDRNEIGFTVNRRTTDGNGDPITEFKFTLHFEDNNGAYTYYNNASGQSVIRTITFIVHVINEAPSADTYVSNLTMRAGDHIAVMTTYYDKFVGDENWKNVSPIFGGAAGSNRLPINHGVDSYIRSKTLASWNTLNDSHHTNWATSWEYRDITSDRDDCGDDGIIENTYGLADRNVFMGYLGLAKDDTPWSMRIDNVTTDYDCFKVETYDNIKYESSDELRPISVVITAVGACVNEPVTFVVSDGEGGTMSYTIYITVISAKPVARNPEDSADNEMLSRSNLEGVKEDNAWKDGVFKVFTIPAGKTENIIVNGFEGEGVKTAYDKITVEMKNVAFDPDGQGETESMTLFNNGMFKVNDAPMPNINETYFSDYFTVKINPDHSSFVLTATGFNANSPYEELSFMINDSGNSIEENACKITIRIYTLYSNLESPYAAALTDADERHTDYSDYLEGKSGNNLRVKSYDEYYGVGSFALSEHVGEASSFALVRLDDNVGVDNNVTSPIVDPDVSVRGKALYTARVYAFIDDNGNALPKSDIYGLFEKNAATDEFHLKNIEDANDYLIGGVRNTDEERGMAISASSTARLAYVNRYADFTVSSDGTSIEFIPRTATLDKTVLIYIEVDKYLGNGNQRSGSVLRAGSLFKLDVKNSAPRNAKESSSVRTFEYAGVKGDGTTFDVFGDQGNSMTLFVDSDIDDIVRLDFDNDRASYLRALARALSEDSALDWDGYDPTAVDEPDDPDEPDEPDDPDPPVVTPPSGGEDPDEPDEPGTGGEDPDEPDEPGTGGEDPDEPDEPGTGGEDPTPGEGGENGDNTDPDQPNPDEDEGGSGVMTARMRNVSRTADEWTGEKCRAFDIVYNEDDNTLSIAINRRMDKIVNGKYMHDVTFPLVFTGYDSMGERCDVVIMLTVSNTAITASYDDYENFDETTRVGYGYRATASSESEDGDDVNVAYDYTIVARVLQSSSYTINVTDFLTDADYVPGEDVDSYMFVGFVKSTSLYENLIKDPVMAMNLDDLANAENVAEVSAVYDDDWHFTGFNIRAITTKREVTGTVYLRIIDRSGDSSQPENGLTLRIDITVMNDRPYVKDGMGASTITLLGSNSDDVESITLSIGDFVGDHNDTDVVGSDSAEHPSTYLRIYTMSFLPAEAIYSTATLDKTGNEYSYDSADLFQVTIASNSYNQLFTIKPSAGFFGTGAIEITVADGDLSEDMYALEVKFRINVEVVYNPDDIATLEYGKPVYRGKNFTVSIDSLMPNISNTIASGGTSTSADGESTFNPASAYMLTNLELAVGASDYLEVVARNGDVWTLHALRVTPNDERVRINVEYALRSDPSVVANGHFMITVLENGKPEMLYSSITFIRYTETIDPDPLRMLNTSQTIYLRADQLLDDPEKDIMKFESAKSQKPSLVSVSINEDKTLLAVTFNGRGSAKITLTVSDETGESCVRSFMAINNDLPSPSFWVSVASSFESYTVVWAAVIGVILLLIIVMIILISRRAKRKREQEELEALLVSEMAIEDTMNRLAGGPTPTDYQSYGYLPQSQQSKIGIPEPKIMDISNALPPSDGQVQGGIGLNPGLDPNAANNGSMNPNYPDSGNMGQ